MTHGKRKNSASKDPSSMAPKPNTFQSTQLEQMRNSMAGQTKYDLNQQVIGQAVGGPRKKTKVSLWDMITLYDTHQKRAEDAQEFAMRKQQQQEIKLYYESQMDFK